MPLHHDASLSSFNALKKLGVAMGLPATVLIDGQGCMLGAMNGPAAWDSDDAKALIKGALGEGPERRQLQMKSPVSKVEALTPLILMTMSVTWSPLVST